MNLKLLFLLMICFCVIYSTPNAQIKRIEIKATGLTCSLCSNAIYKQLNTISEIDSICIDLNSTTFQITLKDNTNLNPEIFREKIEKAGFFIGYMEIISTLKLLDNPSYQLIDSLPNTEVKFMRFQILNKGYTSKKEYTQNLQTYPLLERQESNNEKKYFIIYRGI